MSHHDNNRFAAVGLLAGAAGAVVLTTASSADVAGLRAGTFDALQEPNTFLRDLANGNAPEKTIDALNAALLAGDIAALEQHIKMAEAAGDADLHAHLRVVAFRMGADLNLPSEEEITSPFVRAYAMAARAYLSASNEDTAAAIAQLRQASELIASASPATAARYIGEAATIANDTGVDATRLLMDLENASDALNGLAFDELCGELHMMRAGMLMEKGAQRPSLLLQAVQCFQKATQALPRRRYPEAYAQCHLNIAISYLSMPMNEHASKLRGAIAVQSLREALGVFTPADHPEYWQAATINLANALQHLPSAHLAENMLEAVRLYETVLEHRTDPSPQRARLLANLGNALAHLGRFDEAKVRLCDARTMFVQEGVADAACASEAPDVVMGQQDFQASREWPYGPQAANVHRFPYSISTNGAALVVSDTANNRILRHRLRFVPLYCGRVQPAHCRVWL